MTATETRPDGNPPPGDHAFFGQPIALANLFGVEMWERFSFYGMQGILLIYLYYSTAQGGLGIDETTATSIVGAYGGLVYLATILGGWSADRLLGSERTLFYSAVLIMFGHIALSVLPGLLGVGVGLVFVALGSGGVKANCSSIVGDLYTEDDERRDAGFSLFYMGINIGALVGPLLTGLVQEKHGFQWGFGLAAFGMALGLIQYTIFRKNLGGIGKRATDPLPAALRLRYGAAAVAALALIGIMIATGVIHASNLSNVTVGVSIFAAACYFAVILTSRQVVRVERHRVIAFIPLFIASVAFWSLFQQIFTVLTIYADKRMNRDIFGWTMPVSWVQSIEPVWVIALAPVFAAMWDKLGERQPSTPIKFALGTAGMGVAFLLFLPLTGSGPNSVPVIAVVGILAVFAVSELLLSPVGLSLATKLAPKAFHTQMVALFYLSIALGTALSGTLATYYDENNEFPYFLWLGLAGIVIGAALTAFARPIRTLMEGVR